MSAIDIVPHFIAGRRVPAESPRFIPLVAPASGEPLGHLHPAGPEVVDETVRKAAEAFREWGATPVKERVQPLFRFRQRVEEHLTELGALVSRENGKTVDEAIAGIRRGLEVVEYACSVPQLLAGSLLEVSPGVDCHVRRLPLGVVGGITPFNFPAMVPMWMFPLAIACGNTFLLKPSEQAALTPLRLAELLQDAGLPDGVFNVVNGDKEAVDTLLTDARVQAVSFVGSTPIAEYIYATGTKHGKRIQALGGAKNHAIVMPDADIDNAVSALMGAAYGSCGERCMAISVAVAVGDEVGDQLVAKLKERLSSLKVGPGTAAGMDMGPLVSKPHFEKVRGYVDLGVEEGADLVVDGRGLTVPGHEEGYFLGGCLFDRVTPEMRIYKEEIFGPVLCVVRVKSQEEAMALIDAHEYGNGTCIFTRDGEAARYFTDNIRVGMVGVNVALPVPVAIHSFGGWKRSLFGDLYAYGPDSVRFYTRRKTITQRWPSGGVRDKAQFAFPSNG